MVQKREIEEQTVRGEEGVVALPRTIHLVPMDHIDGFDVRPGFTRSTALQPSPAA